MSGREFSAAADLGDVVSEVRRSERVPAKKAKEAQLEAARLAKELAAAAEVEQQVDADLEASASQGVVLEQEEEPAAEAVQTEVPVGNTGSEPVSKRLVSIRVMQMQAAVLKWQDGISDSNRLRAVQLAIQGRRSAAPLAAEFHHTPTPVVEKPQKKGVATPGSKRSVRRAAPIVVVEPAEAIRKATSAIMREREAFGSLLEDSQATSLADGLKAAEINTASDVACYTATQLKHTLEEVGCGARIHVCERLVKAAKSKPSPAAVDTPGAHMDGTAGSRHASAETGSLFAELMGSGVSVNYGGGEGQSMPHSLNMGVASAALKSGLEYGQSSSGAGLQGLRSELIGLVRAQSLFSRVEPSVETNELVRQGIEILECKSSDSDEMAAELFEAALARRGLEPEQLRPDGATARDARSHLMALCEGKRPASNVAGLTNASCDEEPSDGAQMFEMLAQTMGKTPVDGKAAMREEVGQMRMARVAADTGARVALAHLASDAVLRSEERLARELPDAMGVHSTLNELLHQSGLNKLPSGALKVNGVMVGVTAMRAVAAQAQKVQAMAFKALATIIAPMCPPSLVVNGNVASMLESVWFQQLGGVGTAGSSSTFKLQSLITEGTSGPKLQGKKMSQDASNRMLLCGMPALASAQMVSNPKDKTAQQVAARLTSLAGYIPTKVQHGTQLIIAPFLVRIERMHQLFEMGCGELPTFQAAWDEVCETPVVKKYIEVFNEVDLAGEEVPAAMQQRLEAMEKQLKVAVESADKARQEVRSIKQRGAEPIKPKPAGGEQVSEKAMQMARTPLSDAKWEALSGAEKWEVKQARKALAAEKKAEKEAKGDDADEE
jgi:hypothetical protein